MRIKNIRRAPALFLVGEYETFSVNNVLEGLLW